MDPAVIIPAHNEAERIGKVIESARHHAQNIVVVDDGSTDGTGEVAKRAGALVLRHAVNMGKGAALKTGCDYAVQRGAQRLLVIDADGQHEPEEIPHFLHELENSELVLGCRRQADSMPLVLRFGNRFINETLRLLYRIKVQDSQCGYRAFTAAAYGKLRWKAQDYYMETEMLVNAGRHNIHTSHHFINTIYGDKYKGTTVLDGVKIVAKMLAAKVLK